MRRLLSAGRATPAVFRESLTNVPPTERDAWVDHVFGLDDLPEDGPELPRGCVPYLPTSVDTLLRLVEYANVQSDDMFVDIGSGIGRATAFVHLLTGAGAIGIEIQESLVRGARELAARLNAPRVAVVHGDAARLTGYMMTGSVFFLYCPFGGARLNGVLDNLESIARTRRIRICCVDLPLPPRPWLTAVSVANDLAVYQSV